MKVILEIDGTRYRLVRGRKPIGTCDKCSVVDFCNKFIGSPCLNCYNYFVKEKGKEIEL